VDLLRHVLDRVLDAVLHPSYVTALLLITLASLGLSGWALWTLRDVVARVLENKKPRC
jgi:hypothetical protein